MSTELDTPSAAQGQQERSAGALLREARESRGLHIAALAATIKVSPRKLDALEGDRHHELPDATFARALASTVCRALKVDPAPILERMPASTTRLSTLEDGGEGLNARFEERSSRGDSGAWRTQRLLILAGAVLVVAAGVLLLLPPGTWKGPRWTPAALNESGVVTTPVPSADTSGPGKSPSALSGAGTAIFSASSPAGSALSETVHAAPPAPPAAGSLPAGASDVWVRVSEPSWVEAVDGGGRALLSRVVQPGESVRLDAASVLNLTIGNAAATQVERRGLAVDLKPHTRDNVARLELR